MGTDARRSRVRLLAIRLGLPLITLALVWTYFAGRLLVLSKALDAPDAIVSLASHEWERLPTAAAAAARHGGAAVLLTQPITVSVHNCHDCAHRRERLASAGVDPSRVSILQLTGEGTRAEAEACRLYARSRPIKRLLIVTSPFHARRSLAVFEHVFAGSGVEIGVEPATGHSEADPAYWWISPYGRWYVAYEWAAVLYYGLHYGIWAFDQ